MNIGWNIARIPNFAGKQAVLMCLLAWSGMTFAAADDFVCSARLGTVFL